MFFILSKTLSFLIFPLPLVMLLFILCIFVRKYNPRVARILFYIALAGLYVFSIAPTSDLLMFFLEYPFGKQAMVEEADAVVVLSGMVDLQRSQEGQVQLSSGSSRIIEGILLVKDWQDALLILSGGSGDLFDQSKSEAKLLEQLAIRLGVPGERIRVDATSRNTHENAVESKNILAKEKVDSSFALVTSAFHMRRAVGCFQKVDLNPIPYPVDFRNHLGKYNLFLFIPRAGNLEKSTLAIREYVGLITYRIRGYI